MTRDMIEARNDKIAYMLANGKSRMEIAKRFSLSRASIEKVAERYGFAKSNPSESSCEWVPTPEEIEKRVIPFRRMRENGLTGQKLMDAIHEYINIHKIKKAQKNGVKRNLGTNPRQSANN